MPVHTSIYTVNVTLAIGSPYHTSDPSGRVVEENHHGLRPMAPVQIREVESL